MSYGLWCRRRDLRAVDVYLGSYLLLVFNVAYYDARYWVPVLPLLLGWVAIAVNRLWKVSPIRWVVGAYVSAFTVAGLVALGYSTRISFAGSRFPELYGDGTLRPAYLEAFGYAQSGQLSTQNVTAALHVLQRYEPRAVRSSTSEHND